MSYDVIHHSGVIILGKYLLFSVIDLLVENLAAGWRRLWILRWGLFFQTGLGSNWSELRWLFLWETDSLQLTTPSDRRIFLEDKVWKLFGIVIVLIVSQFAFWVAINIFSTRMRPNSCSLTGHNVGYNFGQMLDQMARLIGQLRSKSREFVLCLKCPAKLLILVELDVFKTLQNGKKSFK